MITRNRSRTILTDVRAEAGVERFPGVIERPLPENMENRLIKAESPTATSAPGYHLDDIKDGIDDTAALGGRKHRFEQRPLGVGKIRVVKSDFHRFNGAAFLIGNVCETAHCQRYSLLSFEIPKIGYFRQALRLSRRFSSRMRSISALVTSLACFKPSTSFSLS